MSVVGRQKKKKKRITSFGKSTTECIIRNTFAAVGTSIS